MKPFLLATLALLPLALTGCNDDDDYRHRYVHRSAYYGHPSRHVVVRDYDGGPYYRGYYRSHSYPRYYRSGYGRSYHGRGGYDPYYRGGYGRYHGSSRPRIHVSF